MGGAAGTGAADDDRPIGPRPLLAAYSAAVGLALLGVTLVAFDVVAGKDGARGILEPLLMGGFAVALAVRTLWRVAVLWTGRHVTSRLTLGPPVTRGEERERVDNQASGDSDGD